MATDRYTIKFTLKKPSPAFVTLLFGSCSRVMIIAPECVGEDDMVTHPIGTGVEGIYAIGDLTALEERQYSHLASAGGIIAAENAMGMDSAFNHRTVTRVVFTQPQVALRWPNQQGGKKGRI